MLIAAPAAAKHGNGSGNSGGVAMLEDLRFFDSLLSHLLSSS